MYAEDVWFEQLYYCVILILINIFNSENIINNDIM